MRYKITVKFLMFWCLFIGIGAVYGSVCMFIDPSGALLGMNDLLKYFSVLPFSDVLFNDYIFSGICLLIVNGLSNLSSFYLLIRGKKLGIKLGTLFGFTLMLWILIQFIIFPRNVLSISFFIFGFIQFITGFMTYVFYMQEREFVFDESCYKNVGTEGEVLVVYFSRMGYTKKIAYSEADKVGGDILEIKTKERISGTLGFWWCGRFGMLRRGMPICDLGVSLKLYKRVVIVSPVWVFSLCAPIREFCYKYSDDINSYDLVLTHFMKSKFLGIYKEVCKILKSRGFKFTSICVRFGKIKKIYIKND